MGVFYYDIFYPNWMFMRDWVCLDGVGANMV